jgi:hypothetical protein
MKYGSILLLATLAFSNRAVGKETLGRLPESEIALLRSDIQTKKTDILQQNLTLSDEQAKTFWPLQRAYENDLTKLGDQRLDVIREYAKNWNDLSDETAKDLGKRLLDYQRKRIDLRSKYFERMSKEISPSVAAKFFQIEMQLEDIIDLEIASAVPLIK